MDGLELVLLATVQLVKIKQMPLMRLIALVSIPIVDMLE